MNRAMEGRNKISSHLKSTTTDEIYDVLQGKKYVLSVVYKGGSTSWVTFAMQYPHLNFYNYKGKPQNIIWAGKGIRFYNISLEYSK